MKKYWIPLAVFTVLIIHGSLLGLTDDEAYYWVLAQKPSWGYAFHPPGVAWMIGLFQGLFGWILGNHQPGLVRLPAALSAAWILGLAMNWLEESGQVKANRGRSAAVLLSFFGFFALAWMMVPDIPLFLGWTLLLINTWKICFGKAESRNFWFLGASTTLLLLAKYSGVLAIASAFFSIALWAPRERKFRGFKFLLLGLGLALFPILYWNAQHEWASILYQIRDRHQSEGISWLRYARFWGIEILFAGPLLVGYGFLLLWKAASAPKKNTETLIWFYLLWILPAALVFCVQPLFADFKPHWAFIVWWPVVLAMAGASSGGAWRWIRFQVSYGFLMGAFVLMSCHLPLGSWVGEAFSRRAVDPRLDASNDLYGWSELGQFIREHLDDKDSKLPIIGSRYQTASQAAFGLGDMGRVTFLPRDLKEQDEWPNLNLSVGQGPEWPVLKQPVLFVADIRYGAGPSFPQADCKILGRFEKRRFQTLAKWIDIWRCNPSSRTF